MYHLTDEFDSRDVEEFSRDFTLVMKLFAKLLDQAEHYDDHVRENVERFREGLELFDKKYPDLNIRLLTDRPSERNFKIVFKTKSSVSEFYKRILNKMKPVTFAGTLEGLYSKPLTNPAHLGGSVAVLFEGNKTILVKNSSKEDLGSIELVYGTDEVTNEKYPSFHLCAYIALRKGIDHSVKVLFPNLKNVSGFSDTNQRRMKTIQPK